MLLLLFHQAEASAGANEVPEVLPIFGGSIISDGLLSSFCNSTSSDVFLSMSISPYEILTDISESSPGF